MSWPWVLRTLSLSKGKLRALSRQPKPSLGAHRGAGWVLSTYRPGDLDRALTAEEKPRLREGRQESHSTHREPARARAPACLWSPLTLCPRGGCSPAPAGAVWVGHGSLGLASSSWSWLGRRHQGQAAGPNAACVHSKPQSSSASARPLVSQPRRSQDLLRHLGMSMSPQTASEQGRVPSDPGAGPCPF